MTKDKKKSTIYLNKTENVASLLSLEEFCKELSISVATGENWVRLGKVNPTRFQRKKPFFSKDYVTTFKQELSNGTNQLLKSRRNKSYLSGYEIYEDYLSKDSVNIVQVKKLATLLTDNKIELSRNEIMCLLLECTLQLICCKIKTDDGTVCIASELPSYNLLSAYLANERFQKIFQAYTPLLKDFQNNLSTQTDNILSFIHRYPELFHISYTYVENEDLLGMLYLSLRSLAKRKATGAYYTPTVVVEKLITNLFALHTDTYGKCFLDPCCGTGNFLLQLPKQIRLEQIYGNDLDATSVLLTRTNMVLKFGVSSLPMIYEHFTISDYFKWEQEKQYDFILGNPPWGSSFSMEDIHFLQKRFVCTSKKPEAYDLAIEQSLKLLKQNGILGFVLPEALLTVKSHICIRQQLLSMTNFEVVEYLGNVFHKVHCPSILLQVKKTKQPFSTNGLCVKSNQKTFTIQTKRPVTASYFSFRTTDVEYTLLEKLLLTKNCTFLKGNAIFALGIVTGNNKKFLSKKNTKNKECIYKGTDLQKYHLKPAENYTTFLPEQFQQVAKEQYYRAPEKLVYRFICNQLVFAYDNGQHITLNSCNILIPKIENLSIKYVLAVLNSRVLQFIYSKSFHSVKVLRSHLEQLPIPVVSVKAQEKVTALVDTIIDSSDTEEIKRIYDEIDCCIAEYFSLSKKEYGIILSTYDGKNLFL